MNEGIILNPLFERMTSFSNLLLAGKKAFRGKKIKKSVSKFFFNLENELFQLQKELNNKTYKPRPYHYFVLKEMKTRTVSSADFRDRVVHHALLNIIENIFEKCFIEDSYACRKNKGTQKAIFLAQKYTNQYKYFMKCDIKKYFDNINHKTLISMISEKIYDNNILWLCELIIKNSVSSEKGIPIGNLTSQFFANVYLDPMDHYTIEKLNMKAYIRYMDDFLVFSDNIENLHIALASINNFLSQELKLRIKENEIMIAPVTEGIPFLGFRIYKNLIRVRNNNLRRTVKKLASKVKNYNDGIIDINKLESSVNSMLGHLKHGNTLNLRKKLFYNTLEG